MLSCFVLTTAAMHGATLAVSCSMFIITKMERERSDHCKTTCSNDNKKEFPMLNALDVTCILLFAQPVTGWGLIFSNGFAIF